MNIAVYGKHGTKQIIHYIQECQKEHSTKQIDIFEFQKCDDMIKSLDNQSYDIAYLDDCIEIETSQQLYNKNPHCIIILMTYDHQFIQKAFYIDAFQYFHYSVSFDLFKEEFDRAMQRYQKRNIKFFLHTTKGNILFRTKEIIYIETYYHQLKIVTLENTYYTDIKQKETLFQILKTLSFIKIQRSFVVNMNYIKEIQSKNIILTNNEKLPTSPLRKEDIIIKYNQFIKKY